MNFFVQRSELRDHYDNSAAGERISKADARREDSAFWSRLQ
jgi:hypothetical protein